MNFLLKHIKVIFFLWLKFVHFSCFCVRMMPYTERIMFLCLTELFESLLGPSEMMVWTLKIIYFQQLQLQVCYLTVTEKNLWKTNHHSVLVVPFIMESSFCNILFLNFAEKDWFNQLYCTYCMICFCSAKKTLNWDYYIFYDFVTKTLWDFYMYRKCI